MYLIDPYMLRQMFYTFFLKKANSACIMPRIPQAYFTGPMEVQALARGFQMNSPNFTKHFGDIPLANQKMYVWFWDICIVNNCIFVLQVETDQFSHLLKGLQYGCPPHGGVALGMVLHVLCVHWSWVNYIWYQRLLSVYSRIQNSL